MLQKNLSKIQFYEKVKMTTNGPFVIESFVTIGLADYACKLIFPRT
jgi:hypothetical protein